MCGVRKIIILLGAIAFVAVGCGSSGSSNTAASASSQTSGGGSSSQPVALSGTTNDHGTQKVTGDEISIEMDDFYFNPTFLQGAPGQTLTVHLKNEGSSAHTFTSTALGADTTVQPGQTADVKVTLPQTGATEYHCRFHQSSGMQGAFFFTAGDPVAGGTAPAGSGSGGASSTGTSSSSSSTSAGGYDYN